MDGTYEVLASGLTTADLNARARRAVSGRLGAKGEILQAAAPWYESVGVDSELVSKYALHPLGHLLAESRHLSYALPVDVATDVLTTALAYETNDIVSAVLSRSHPADPALDSLLAGRCDDAEVVAPQDRHATVVREAVDFALSVGSDFAHDTISYLTRLALVSDQHMVGTTWTDTVGLMAMNPVVLSDPPAAAESLLHEALHSKTALIERGFRETFPSEDDKVPLVTVPWRKVDGHFVTWTSLRTFDAYYVYSHLSMFTAMRVKLLEDYSALDRLRRVAFRAEYLRRRVDDKCRGELGDERLDLAEWLDKIRISAFDLSENAERLLDRMPDP